MRPVLKTYRAIKMRIFASANATSILLGLGAWQCRYDEVMTKVFCQTDFDLNGAPLIRFLGTQCASLAVAARSDNTSTLKA